MARIDLPEDYAVRFARQSIRDSLMSHGEEVVLMHMYHTTEADGHQPRCPACFDAVYQQGERYDCDRCYGTTFDGGVSQFWRSWAIFTDAIDTESITKRGHYHPIVRNLHTEHLPDIHKRDYVVRVTGWTRNHEPTGVEGIYVFDDVNNESVRTGNQAGQITRDSVGQRADLTRIDEAMPIYRFPLIGIRIERFDGKER